jgi:hypothetical protein
MRRAHLLAAASLTATAAAFLIPVQDVGCGQSAHYVAVRALAGGVANVDRYAGETCDLVRYGGHFYTAKAPMLAVWTLPWYALLHAVGALPAGPRPGAPYPAAMLAVPVGALWALGAWAIAAPALALLLLVRRTVEQLEPGTGTAAAAILGLGTLVLPFSTMLFAHVPAALLAFLSFALLLERSARSRRALAAGAAAGLAVSTDLPLAVPALLLAAYAAAAAPRLRRLALFAAGGILGLAPLLAFDAWAFGSPFRLAYSHAAIDPGPYGVEQTHAHTFFTLGVPHLRIAVELLLGGRGLLVLTPVLAAAAAGIVLLWRRGLRAEAGLLAALAVAEIAWNAGRPDYPLALGGWVPGPRLLIPLLPFLCLALAPALRRVPATVGALGAVSVGAMTLATSAGPLLPDDDTHHWVARLADGNLVRTVFSFAGAGHGLTPMLPFYALVLVGAGAAAAATRLPTSRRDIAAAAAAVVAWMLLEHAAPRFFLVDAAVHMSWGLAAAVLLLVALAWAIVSLHRGSNAALLVAAPLLAFATVRVAEHAKWSVALCALVLAALASASWLPQVRSSRAIRRRATQMPRQPSRTR